MNINKEIGIKLKYFRKKAKYNQEHVAQMLGITRASYVNMEAGRQGLKPIHVYNVCRIFKINPTQLFPKILPTNLKSRTITRKVIIMKRKQKVFLKI